MIGLIFVWIAFSAAFQCDQFESAAEVKRTILFHDLQLLLLFLHAITVTSLLFSVLLLLKSCLKTIAFAFGKRTLHSRRRCQVRLGVKQFGKSLKGNSIFIVASMPHESTQLQTTQPGASATGRLVFFALFAFTFFSNAFLLTPFGRMDV